MSDSRSRLDKSLLKVRMHLAVQKMPMVEPYSAVRTAVDQALSDGVTLDDFIEGYKSVLFAIGAYRQHKGLSDDDEALRHFIVNATQPGWQEELITRMDMQAARTLDLGEYIY